MDNYEQAVMKLSQAKTVQEWNQIREGVKDTLSPSELCRIDSQGLIVQILGQDPIPYRTQYNIRDE